jgi:hypothetical protein
VVATKKEGKAMPLGVQVRGEVGQTIVAGTRSAVSDLTIRVGRRDCALTGLAPAWLYSLIEDDDDLVETRAAIHRGIAGLEVEFPDAETDSFCERLREVFAALSPAERSEVAAQQVLALASAVRSQSSNRIGEIPGPAG